MNNKQFLKWGCVASLVFGLSGCYMDSQSAQESTYSTANSTPSSQSTASEPQAKQKSYASKEPTQKSTPGPKQTAAPQLPVIQ
ncbi:hypothetical protein Lmor_1817 [Legionella moravica]|uniref:Lipoprotein n=1 Tax=Legionella moravica TaxID=39962 RepID=A0A378K3J3_9GAMM|nr:hypothetical protein [Legionella moravica]KTD34420.1 hypothetical protein Lmor_1817 [Legionella moravica]STX64138.1 Uncharacterised protein [Legionella moravica]